MTAPFPPFGVELAIVLTAVVAGATVHGSLGFGFAFVAVPALVILYPGALPVTLLILGIGLAASMGVRERTAVDLRGSLWMILGRMLGVAVAVVVLSTVSPRLLQVLFGAMILLAVATSAVGRTVSSFSARNLVVGGLASGLLGTTVAMGGPPLALVYQERSGPELRSTLAVTFTTGGLLSLGALILIGHAHLWHATLAALLVPGMLVGLAVSSSVTRFLDGRWVRPGILGLAGTAGLLSIARGVIGAV